MREALAESCGEVADAIARLRRQGASAPRVVVAMCDYFAGGLEATDLRSGCPVAAVAMESHENPALREEASKILAQWRSSLEALLVEEGRLPSEALDVAEPCIAAVEGALLLSKLRRRTDPLATVGRQLESLVASIAR